MSALRYNKFLKDHYHGGDFLEDHLNDRTKAQKEQDKKEALELLEQIEKEEKQSAGKKSSGKKREKAEKSRSDNENGDDWKDLIYPDDNKKKRRGNILLPLLFVAIVIAAAAVWFVKYAPTGKRMDSKTYFEEMMSSSDNKVSLEEDELAVILENNVSPYKARLTDGGVYFNYDMARENLNSRFFWDEENVQMLFTTAYETYEIPANSETYTIDGEEKSFSAPVVLLDERGLYLSADFLQLYTNVEYTLPETDESGEGKSTDKKSAEDLETPDHMRVLYEWGTKLTAQAKRNSAVRYYGGVKGLIITKVKKGDTVRVVDRMKNWSRIVTADGFIGYMQNKDLTEPLEEEITREFDEIEYPSIAMDETVNLVWHMTGIAESNDYFASDTEGMKGVNVISPTWFSLEDNEGNISSIASKAYVRKAHKKGLKVWGLVSNFSTDMSTTALVASTSARRNLTANLIDEALKCGMDGINFDLEAIAEEAGYGYVQLVRELSIECRKNNLVLSVDVPVPFDFNEYYDRKELGTVADYVIIMGYDEHYSGSEAGSVASLSFEENGIKKTLEDVPAEKIISGVPFYTRMWYTAEDESGNESTWSEVLGMRAVLNTLDTYGVTPEWDEETKQYLASWTLDDGTLCRIWMEEAESLALKAALVKKYELAGIAEWALGNQIDEMWDVISENIA